MDSLPSGSKDTLLSFETDNLSFTIKGPVLRPAVEKGYSDKAAVTQIVSKEPGNCLLLNKPVMSYSYMVSEPVFYEQRVYEIVVEWTGDGEIQFWHDNPNIRNKITRIASRKSKIYSGVINFGSDIGFSDIEILHNGSSYFKCAVEVFPSKISYKDDYQALLNDVTSEIYNLSFDFLKKTYSSYRQGSTAQSSPVEFFAIIRKIFRSFLKSIDYIIAHPQHALKTTYQIQQAHKIKRTDSRTLRWLEKHPENLYKTADRFLVTKALSPDKEITYDTPENRYVKQILFSTIRRLRSFLKRYKSLWRDTDEDIVNKVNKMIDELDRRLTRSFLSEIGEFQSASGFSLVFAMAPGYQSLYRYYLILQKGLSISGDFFDVSIKDLAQLYEYWCFIKLNSLLKDKYELVSQDIIRANRSGLFVTLVKGNGSKVEYRIPQSDEKIILAYNQKESQVPTVPQKPDNILKLVKNGSDVQYEYIFDAKYRINPSLEGSFYNNRISTIPGPEIDDINTMHRYRDAIVYEHQADPVFERTMFGAYVLFPYKDEERYLDHRFYQSIEKVNIGGLPFLPSATSLVEKLLDELIEESPISAMERATLPSGIEEQLQKVDWSVRDVMIGALSRREQLEEALKNHYYHILVKAVKKDRLPIRKIALYQSKRLFGDESGIRYIGEVLNYEIKPGKEISSKSRRPNEQYYVFHIKNWKRLAKPIRTKEQGVRVNQYTNEFLVENADIFPDLLPNNEETYRLYSELKYMCKSVLFDENNGALFTNFHDAEISIIKNELVVRKEEQVLFRKDLKYCSNHVHSVMKKIRNEA